MGFQKLAIPFWEAYDEVCRIFWLLRVSPQHPYAAIVAYTPKSCSNWIGSSGQQGGPLLGFKHLQATSSSLGGMWGFPKIRGT